MNKIPLHYSILFPGIFQEPGKPIGTAILFCFQIFSSTVSAHHKWLLGGVNFDWFDDPALSWSRKWRCKFFLLCRLSLNLCNALKLVTSREQVLCKYHLMRLQLKMPILPSLYKYKYKYKYKCCANTGWGLMRKTMQWRCQFNPLCLRNPSLPNSHGPGCRGKPSTGSVEVIVWEAWAQ